MPNKKFRVAVDTGGTFTDAISSSGDGVFKTAKSLTTPRDLTIGIINVLQILSEKENGISLQEFLDKTKNIVIGTTAAVNSIMSLNGAKAAMINTRGFTDILEQRRILRSDLFDWKLPKPVILIPRYLRFGIEERIASTGKVITPLNEDSAREAVRKAKANKVELIAICLLHSYINSEHEQKLAKIVQEEYPEAKVLLSSEVWPHIVEWPRFITTAVGAYVTPAVARFLSKLRGSLEEKGFKNKLIVVTQDAQLLSAQEASDHAWSIVGSSRAGSPLSAVSLGNIYNVKNVMMVDMGGTSFNVCAFPARAINMGNSLIVGDQLIASESVDAETIGAGGSSVAWPDERGMLHIGPASAGADPGPACYRKGGKKPTVTDADVVLGYIPTDNFLGGEVTIDANLAYKAIEKEIAKPLSIDTVEAAYFIRKSFDTLMANQILLALVARGYSKSDFTLFITGGAGPTHAFDIAKKLGFRQIYIPKSAPVSGSLGMLFADYRYSFTKPLFKIEKELDVDEVNRAYKIMEGEGIKRLAGEGIALKDISIIKGAYMRFYGQASELRVSLPEMLPDTSFTKDTLKALIEAFHKTHQEKRGYTDRNSLTYIHNLNLSVIGKNANRTLPEMEKDGQASSRALKREREVFFKELNGFVKTPCFDGDKLKYGNIIKGPAIIEERATTIVIPPEAEVDVDKYGSYVGKF